MITIVMICYWHAYELANAYHLPEKFKGYRRRRPRERRKARRWRKGIRVVVRKGATIDERMVGRRVGWIRFHKSTCGLPVHPSLAQN